MAGKGGCYSCEPILNALNGGFQICHQNSLCGMRRKKHDQPNKASKRVAATKGQGAKESYLGRGEVITKHLIGHLTRVVRCTDMPDEDAGYMAACQGSEGIWVS